jgi:hypothetical protein
MTSLKPRKSAPKPRDDRRAEVVAVRHPKPKRPFALVETGKGPVIKPRHGFSEAILEWLEEEDYL